VTDAGENFKRLDPSNTTTNSFGLPDCFCVRYGRYFQFDRIKVDILASAPLLIIDKNPPKYYIQRRIYSHAFKAMATGSVFKQIDNLPQERFSEHTF
jgi:hypothetical protein